MLDHINDPTRDLAKFHAVAARDASYRADFDWSASWRHLEKRLSEGALAEMGFTGFDGPPLIARMLGWIDKIPYPCAYDDPRLGALARAELEVATAALRQLGLDPTAQDLPAVARYTAQDIFFQTESVALPPRDRPARVLDFGAGHGRLIPFWASAAKTHYVADATPGPYLAQAMWARAAGLEVNEYLDNADFTPREGAVNHLPSWRLDLIPEDGLDLIMTVQVLRELSKPMLAFAVGHFARMLRPGGRLYIRDHIGFHNVNAVDLDALLAASGFVAEWQPHLVDRVDIHGVPRIWRRADAAVTLGGL